MTPLNRIQWAVRQYLRTTGREARAVVLPLSAMRVLATELTEHWTPRPAPGTAFWEHRRRDFGMLITGRVRLFGVLIVAGPADMGRKVRVRPMEWPITPETEMEPPK